MRLDLYDKHRRRCQDVRRSLHPKANNPHLDGKLNMFVHVAIASAAPSLASIIVCHCIRILYTSYGNLEIVYRLDEEEPRANYAVLVLM